MQRLRLLIVFATLSVLLTGLACGSAEPERAASDERRLIEEAIDRHLAKRSDLDFSAMQVSVNRVNFVDDDKAEATVRFQVGEDDGASIQMTYSLARVDSQWEVTGTPSMGGGQGSQAAPPANGGGLPPSHPPTGGQQLPSGHPPVN